MNDFKSVVKKLSSVFFCKLSRSHPAAYREMPSVSIKPDYFGINIFMRKLNFGVYLAEIY